MKRVAKPLRSVLYMPSSNKRAIDKSLTSLNADAFIYDLEDSVSSEGKLAAREYSYEALTKPRNTFGSQKILRINATSSSFFHEDASLLNSIGGTTNTLDAVLLAKVESPDDVHRLEKEASTLFNGDVGIWCMIETPLGVLKVNDIIKSSPRINTLVLGLEDLRSDMNCRAGAPNRFNIMYAMQSVILSAKAHEVNVLDGVYIDMNNEEGFASECEQGVDLGMDGKTLIHPKTIEVSNKFFSPSPEEVEKAKKMIECFEAAEKDGKGIAVLYGSLVEELHVRRARKLLQVAEALKMA